MNVYDSELVARLLSDRSYRPVHTPGEADVVFVNTCSVREGAEERVLARLDQFMPLKRAKPELVIGVLGCMAQSLKGEILEKKPQVNFVLGPDSYGRLPYLLDDHQVPTSQVIETRLSKVETYDYIYPLRGEGVNAWVAIMRGCDKFCTFCIVPYTRGRERSKPVAAVVSEVAQAAGDGFVEVTLLGQNVNSYNDNGVQFPELLERVSEVEGIRRIRFTSPHPQDVSEELIRVMAEDEKVCNHMHLPLQAGSDRVLRRMNRTYTQASFIELAYAIQAGVADVSITTDIIVGFPGETEADFQETLNVVAAVRFDGAFTFKYSPRRGTPAAKWKDAVPDEVKGERLRRLVTLQKEIALEKNKALRGKELEVLIEGVSKKSERHLKGRTTTNKIVVFPKNGYVPGMFVKMRITDASGVTLFGEPIGPSDRALN